MKWTFDQLAEARKLLADHGDSHYPPQIRGSGGFRMTPEQIESLLQTYLINDVPFHAFLGEMKAREDRHKRWVRDTIAFNERERERLAQRERENPQPWFARIWR